MRLKGVRLVRQDDIRYWATADDPDSARRYEAVLDAVAHGVRVVQVMLEDGTLTRQQYARLVRLACGWQWILDRHECTEDGRCEACPRNWLRRRPRWPCRLWRDAHDILITT
jgi:hypothetical protein